MDQFQEEDRLTSSSELLSGAVSSTKISCLWSYACMLSDIWKAGSVYQFFACFESCRTSLELASSSLF